MHSVGFLLLVSISLGVKLVGLICVSATGGFQLKVFFKTLPCLSSRTGPLIQYHLLQDSIKNVSYWSHNFMWWIYCTALISRLRLEQLFFLKNCIFFFTETVLFFFIWAPMDPLSLFTYGYWLLVSMSGCQSCKVINSLHSDFYNCTWVFCSSKVGSLQMNRKALPVRATVNKYHENCPEC